MLSSAPGKAFCMVSDSPKPALQRLWLRGDIFLDGLKAGLCHEEPPLPFWSTGTQAYAPHEATAHISFARLSSDRSTHISGTIMRFHPRLNQRIRPDFLTDYRNVGFESIASESRSSSERWGSIFSRLR